MAHSCKSSNMIVRSGAVVIKDCQANINLVCDTMVQLRGKLDPSKLQLLIPFNLPQAKINQADTERLWNLESAYQK